MGRCPGVKGRRCWLDRRRVASVHPFGVSFLTRARLPFVLFACLLCIGAESRASAQEAAPQIGTSPKGSIGLALVGAELGLAVPAALRVKNPWILSATGVVGAAGGALAGHYLLDKRETGATRALSISFLALGLAGLVPTTLLVVRTSRYVPPSAEGGASDAALRDAGGGLVRVAGGQVGLGLPAVMFSRAEFRRDVRETRFALLSGRF